MTGLIEAILLRLYGLPTVESGERLDQYRWNVGGDASESVLYKRARQSDLPAADPPTVLRQIYGDAIGGSLVGGAVKVGVLTGSVFGLYGLAELQSQPEVVRALARDARIAFFMDAANVWYYGVKDSTLVVYDSETDELDPLGTVEMEIERLVKQWQET